ncbi:hypothetical protein NLU13_8582 [Sarocladium strictum]|uniref:Uncharacterized protein n=1 Tax=Sarocladium strictum TaxID=5046 RepID=A0AA39L4S9_SARSR|nr:hypothetical protein NLU13_8582 [Sarocladium strictum]
MALSTHSTPKRKRGESESVTRSPLKFSFDGSLAQDSRDGSSSPRSKVAHRFRGLGLHEPDVGNGSGGGVAATPAGFASYDEEPDNTVKRQRHDEVIPDADEPPRVVSDLTDAQVSDAVGITDVDGKTVPQPDPVKDEQLETRAARDAEQAPELVPDTSPPKPLGKKRAGTPPLRVKKLLSKMGDSSKDVVDPVRAALTWHEDEITIYDPDDEDDDGTGINGVGFKPTAAIAHARAMKRRQQMAEYKRREESDARARRNQRRKSAFTSRHASAGSSSSPPGSQGDGAPPEDVDRSPRKVRFTDVEAPQVAITTK